MKLILGIFFALLLHAAFILFGGLLFPSAKEGHGSTREVQLLSAEDPQKEKEKEKEDPEKKEKVEAEEEAPPDAAEIIRNMEVSAAAAAPALDAVSLSSLESALSGQSGGGDFAEALSFSSGGRIGGTGKAGTQDEKLDNAFSMDEIDQKPQCVFQSAPNYPAEMRGKNVEGTVTVIFVVDAAGKVSNPRIEKSSHPAFEKPALDAVKNWKFEPAVRGGQRVAAKMRVSLRFQKS